MDDSTNPYAASQVQPELIEPIGPWRSAKRGALAGAIVVAGPIFLLFLVAGIWGWFRLAGRLNRAHILMQQLVPPLNVFFGMVAFTAFSALLGAVAGAIIGWDRRRHWRRKIATLEIADHRLPP
jgi:hypothetical protein